MRLRNTTLAGLAVAMTVPTADEAAAQVDPAALAPTALIEAPEVVDCTLENGTRTRCHRIKVGYLPEGLEIGPFCPATLDESGGIWEWTGDHAGLYRVDRDFFMMLDDLGYRFFDSDGTVHIVDIATAPPEADHACINVSPDESVEITMLLPVTPVMAEAPTPLGTVAKVGLALDGVPVFSDAPQIQHTGHMPALDVCGGHIDPGGWYHWHATSTDIETTFAHEGVAADCLLAQDPTALFGYAFDGFAILGSRETDGSLPQDLDACNGHVGAIGESGEEIYHYHASETFPNLPACLVGVQARGNFVTTATAGIGATRAGLDGRGEPPRPGHGGPGHTPPGFEQAARQLGVSVEVLMRALGDPRGGRPDLAAAARTLGVSEHQLRTVLPPPPPR